MSVRKPDRWKQKRYGVLGLLVVVCVFGILSIVPGWLEHGLAAMVAGCVGLLWILVTLCLTRRFTLSIMLCAVASIAMVMSGYQGIIEKMIKKDRMLTMIRDAGGDVSFVGLPQHSGPMAFSSELGLIVPVPKSYRHTLSRVYCAWIPNHIFTPANVVRWPLNGSEVMIQCESKLDVVDATALEMLPKSCPGIGIQRGRLDRRGVQALKRFDRLEVFVFSLNDEPIPGWISDLNDLRTIRLYDAAVGQADTDKIAGLSKLRHVLLCDSRIRDPKCASTPRHPDQLHRVSLVGCTVDSTMIQWCGSMLADGNEFHGYLEIGPATLPDSWQNVPAAQVQWIRDVDSFAAPLTDQHLMSMTQWPNLQKVRLTTSKVTKAGAEAFKKARPDVEFDMN